MQKVPPPPRKTFHLHISYRPARSWVYVHLAVRQHSSSVSCEGKPLRERGHCRNDGTTLAPKQIHVCLCTFACTRGSYHIIPAACPQPFHRTTGIVGVLARVHSEIWAATRLYGLGGRMSGEGRYFLRKATQAALDLVSTSCCRVFLRRRRSYLGAFAWDLQVLHHK